VAPTGTPAPTWNIVSMVLVASHSWQR